MPRTARIEYEGAVYHVLARGNERRAIVRDDADRGRFLETLTEVCGKNGWRVHAWVLMTNHYHLLLETPEPNLVTGMRWLQGTWTARFNARHRRSGHLFQGRYKALPVEDDAEYFATLGSYIHLNPARAGLVEPGGLKLENYPWSSYSHYLKKEKPPWLDRAKVLGGLGLADTPRGRLEYKRTLQKRLLELFESEKPWEVDERWKDLRRGWHFGSEAFAAELLERLEGVIGVNGKRESYRGEEIRLHGEREAERLVRDGLERLKLGDARLATLPKGASEKVVLTSMLKRRTSVSNSWIAERLKLGHPANVPRLMRQEREATARSPLGKLSNLLKCED